MAAAREGDADSFAELYRRYYAAAVGIAYSTLSDRHLAEDAAQEAFAVACRDFGRAPARRQVRPLAQRDLPQGGVPPGEVEIRAAECRKTGRGRRPRNSATIAQELREHRANLVRQSVQRLPARGREIVLLRYFSGLTHEQIAAALGISAQAVHSRLARAKRKMADFLKRNGVGRREP